MSLDSLVKTFLITPELTRNAFIENLSLVDLNNTCKAFPHMFSHFKARNRTLSLPLMDYTFTIIISNSNDSQQYGYDGHSRIIFFNEVSMEKEISYFKNIRDTTPLMHDVLSICIEDRRSTKLFHDDIAYGEIIGRFINELLEIFDNASTINFKIYNKQFSSSLPLYAIDNITNIRIKTITNLNFSKAIDYVNNNDLENRIMFSNLSSLEQITITALEDHEYQAILTLEAFLDKANIKKNLCINISNIKFGNSLQKLSHILYQLYTKGSWIKLKFNNQVFQHQLLGYDVFRQIPIVYVFKKITEIKLKINDFQKLSWIVNYGVNVKSLALYIDTNSSLFYLLSDKYLSNIQLLKSYYPLINLTGSKSLVEVAFITQQSIIDDKLFKPLTTCFKYIVDYFIDALPKRIRRLTLSGDDYLNESLLNKINYQFPNLEVMILRKMIIKETLNLKKFLSMKFLYLSYVNCFKIVGKLNTVVIEHGGKFEMEKPENISTEWNMIETEWECDSTRLGPCYDYFHLEINFDRYFQIYSKNVSTLVFSSNVFKKHRENIKWIDESGNYYLL
ncbi:Hypothetical protein SRAE_X000125000 [Strongyloides ratti]|uniref:F-box domain-containing protein n=1 Tax=Strongyloides ratti TaxID=34506 RepID=A0A090KW50_STRRB|nr:Hypothetical protein SRAE_X000125000 [Strongyloides ratti]CEF59502.1 Hypothetical protein SRAE_X000125000 [Strongyloides ratti]